MLHDADLPIAPEAAARWNAASDQEKALAYVGMQLEPQTPYRMSALRNKARNLWLNNVSWLAMRNTGVLMSQASKDRAKSKEQFRREKALRFAEMYGGPLRSAAMLAEYEDVSNGRTIFTQD
jgi:hypothetical protein